MQALARSERNVVAGIPESQFSRLVPSTMATLPSRRVTCEKGPCIEGVRKNKMLESLVCVPCGERIHLSRFQLKSRNLVLRGVCLRLHGSDAEKQSLRQK
jgi:hypothetical protein